ncbi:MAG: sensor histidine kinase [Thaumarchaeota archaeon]|nr:sensor histidine kinase [Nitrososphaerota archaeon]
MKIREKLLAALLAVSLIPLLSLAVISLQESNKELEENELLSLSKILDEETARIFTTLDVGKKDTLFLANTPAIPRIFNGIENDGIDPDSGESVEFYKNRMSGYWSSVMDVKNEIRAIELYDIRREPVVIVERIDGHPQRDFELIPNYNHIYFFEKTTPLEKNEIFISDIEKHSSHDDSYTLSYVTPAYASGNPKGFLLIEVFAEIVIFDLLLQKNEEIILADQDGNIIRHNIRGEELVSENNIREYLGDKFPTGFFESESGQLRTSDIGLVAFRKVQFDPQDQSRFYTLVTVSQREITSELNLIIGIITTATAAIVVVFSFFIAKRFSRPLKELATISKNTAKGNFAIKSDITSKDEFGELAITMNQTSEQLKQLQRQRDEFSTMITHELKTPLFPIIGYCKMLKKADMIGYLNEEQLKAVETIERNARGLERLIGDILDINKLELEKLKFVIEEFPLDEFITNLDSSSKDIVEQKGIEFVIDSNNIQGLVIKSDKNRLRQVFDNLINNSSKFINKQGGKIEVGAKKEDNQILFYVKDNGMGIPSNKQKDLFKKFYQVDTSLERSEGSGLGLVICKAITEKLGGKIWVESQEGKGSTFYFTISSNIVRKK